MRRAWIQLPVLTTIFLSLAASACGPGDASPDGSADAAASRVRIRASEGGSVQSPDGIFTLIVPPGAIEEDTDFSISIAPRAAWPAAADEAPPVGEVYQVEPSGLVFGSPAIGIFEWPSAPAPWLREGNRSAGLVVWTVGAGGALEPSPEVLTRHYLDGRIAVGGLVTHLSPKWASSVLSSGGGTDDLFTVTVDADAGEHAVGEPWSARSMTYSSTYHDPMSAVRTVAIAGQRGPHVQVSFPMGSTREHLAFDGPYLVPDASGSQEAPAPPSGGFDTPLPVPTWRCADAGPDAIWAGVHASGPNAGGRGVDISVIIEIGDVTCTGGPVAPPVADHVLIADTCRLEPSGAGVTCSATSGSTIEIQHLSDADRAGCTPIGADTLRCTDSTGDSERGADPIEISTSTASCTATYDDTERNYVCGIGAGESVFGATDVLHVVAVPPGETAAVSLDVPAPDAIVPVEDILGEIDGPSTTVEAPDGTFDAFYIDAHTRTASARHRIQRLVLAEEATLSDGVRSTPLFSPEVIAATAGEQLEVVVAGPIRFTENDRLFQQPGAPATPRATLVVAGRFVEVRAEDLVPPPEPGAIVTRSCGSLPYFFTPVTDRSLENGLVCLYGDGRCMVTNDLRSDVPLLPSQCNNPDRALVLLGGGASPSVSAGGAWHMPYASTGVSGSLDTTTSPPDGTDEAVVIERISDGARYRIDYNLGAAGLNVASVAPFTGPLPSFGAKYDAADTPRTFSSPTTVGEALVYARFCWENTGLYVFGNTDGTPETEICNAGIFAAALIWTPTEGSTIDPTHPSGASTWTVESASAGTYSPGGVTMLPTGVDVTAVITGPRGRFEMVFRCIPGGFTLISARTL